MTSTRRVKRVDGQIVKIDLNDGTHAYGRVLGEPLIAFYDRLYCNNSDTPVEEIIALPIAFSIWVMNHAITRGTWPVIGRVPLAASLEAIPTFFKQDPITGELSIYRSAPLPNGTLERPATYEECLGLERAAVWDPVHVEDRLRDHFAGRESKWVKSLGLAKQ